MFWDSRIEEAVEFQQLRNTVLAINWDSISERVRLGLCPFCSCWKAAPQFCNGLLSSLLWADFPTLNLEASCPAGQTWDTGTTVCHAVFELRNPVPVANAVVTETHWTDYWSCVHKNHLYVVPIPGVLFCFRKVREKNACFLVCLFCF